MKNPFKKLKLLGLISLIIFIIIELTTGFFKSRIGLILAQPGSLTMNIKAFPEGYPIICADGRSSIRLEVTLYDSNHNPVPFSLIHVKLNNFSGTVLPRYPVTNKSGLSIISIYPTSFLAPEEGFEAGQIRETPVSLTLDTKKSIPCKWSGKVSSPPVILIHGFQDTSQSMVPLKNFLEGRGMRVYSFDYDTNTDIKTMASTLERTLLSIQTDLKENGIFADQVDIVAHSLGGLVSRYYTSRHSYINNSNVRKIIFINVPHHGTPWAEAGARLLNAPFLEELYPTSDLFTTLFPHSINKGLNHNIQIANMALENDEVIPLPGSMLTSWNINTKIYRIGSEPISLESVMGDPISGGSHHRQILFYTSIFEEIFHLLGSELPYPVRRK